MAIIIYLPYVSAFMSHPLVQCPFPYEAQQLVIDQIKIFLPSIYDCDNDIMTNSFLWVM